MKHKSKKTNLTLEEIEGSLKSSFPELVSFYNQNIFGKFLVIQHTNAIGLGIWVKADTIKIQQVIPSKKTAMFVGAFGIIGVGISKIANRNKRKQFDLNITTHILKTY